jgi:hypothetical protein
LISAPASLPYASFLSLLSPVSSRASVLVLTDHTDSDQAVHDIKLTQILFWYSLLEQSSIVIGVPQFAVPKIPSLFPMSHPSFDEKSVYLMALLYQIHRQQPINLSLQPFFLVHSQLVA